MLASAAASAWSTYLHWLPYRRSMRFFHLPMPIEIRCLRPRRLHVLPYKIAISGLHKQWRRGAWDRLESLLRATASATPPSLVALSSSPSRGVAKTVAAMGAGLSAWPPGMQILCSVSDMTGAMPQPRRDTFTEFPARGHRGMIVRYPTAVMARSGGSSLRQLVGSPRHTEEHQSMRCRSCHSSTSTATPSSLT